MQLAISPCISSLTSQHLFRTVLPALSSTFHALTTHPFLLYALFIGFLGTRESTAYLTVRGCEWYGLVTNSKWKTVAVINGKGVDGVSYSSCSPQHELKYAQKHHKPMAMEQKSRWSSNTSFSRTYSFRYSLWHLSSPPFWGHVAAGAESSTAVSANCQLAGWWKKVKGKIPSQWKVTFPAYTWTLGGLEGPPSPPCHLSTNHDQLSAALAAGAPIGWAPQLRARSKSDTWRSTFRAKRGNESLWRMSGVLQNPSGNNNTVSPFVFPCLTKEK